MFICCDVNNTVRHIKKGKKEEIDGNNRFFAQRNSF